MSTIFVPVAINSLNPITLKRAETLWSFGLSECNRVKHQLFTVCPPIQGDNPQALAHGLSPKQGDKLWYNYFIPHSSVKTLHCMKYFVLKFANSGMV